MPKSRFDSTPLLVSLLLALFILLGLNVTGEVSGIIYRITTAPGEVSVSNAAAASINCPSSVLLLTSEAGNTTAVRIGLNGTAPVAGVGPSLEPGAHVRLEAQATDGYAVIGDTAVAQDIGYICWRRG